MLQEGSLIGRPRPSSSGPVVKQSTVPKLPCPVTMGAEDRAVLLEVVGFYHDTLKKTPDALRYLEKRGLKSSEMMERFKLGFSDRMLGPGFPLFPHSLEIPSGFPHYHGLNGGLGV